MEIRVLKYFLAVAREENITKAADVLHISQPSLSTQIKNLEDEIEKKLFVRGKRKLSLTEDGMLLRKRAQEIIDLINITESELSNTDEDINEELNIGAGESECMRLIAKTISKLYEKYSGMHFNLSSGNQIDVMDKLDKGLIDFGILIEPDDIKKYNYYKLPYFDESGIITRSDNKLAKLKYITKKDIENEPLTCSIQSLKNNEYNSLLPDNPNIIGSYNLVYNATLLVQEGVCSMVCINNLVNTNSSNLVFIPFKKSHKINCYLVWKKYQPLSKGATKFLEEIEKI